MDLKWGWTADIPKIHRINITFALNRKKLYIFIYFAPICNIIACHVQAGLYISKYCLFVLKIVENSFNSARNCSMSLFLHDENIFLGV